MKMVTTYWASYVIQWGCFMGGYCFVLRMAILEAERAGFASQLSQNNEATSELQLQCDRVRAELTCSRSELDQYRVRAQRILQDKERLIAELQGQG